MKVEVDIHESDIIAFFVHELGRATRPRRRILMFSVVGLCSFVGLVFLLGMLIDQPSPGGWLGPIVIAVVVALYLIWHFWYGARYPAHLAKNLLANRC